MRTKNYLMWIMVLLAPLCFISCSDSSHSYLATSLEDNVLNVDGNTFEYKVAVESSSSWSVNMPEGLNWVNLDVSDVELFLRLLPNDTESVRRGTVVLSNQEGLVIELLINQAVGLVSELELSHEGDNWLNYHEECFEFTVSSQLDITLELISADWIKFNKDLIDDITTIKLTFDKNLDKEKRVARVVVKSGKESKSLTVIQRGQKGFEDVTHQFYMHFATFPLLYSAMDMVQQDVPTWIVDARNTLDTNEYAPNVTQVPLKGFTQRFIDEIANIDKNNPDAVFGYTTEDLRSIYSLAIFTQLGIDSSRVKVNIHPDGTGTYIGLYNTQFGELDGEDKYKRAHRGFLNFYNSLLQSPAKGQDMTDKGMTDNRLYPHIFARCPNVRYYIQSKDYLISKSQYVLDQIPLTNYCEKTPIEILQSLSKEQQAKFYNLVGFNPETYRKLFDESPKKNLIILGTNTAAGHTSARQQANYVQKVIDYYGEEYDIFFKAHPADPAYKNYEQKFPGLRLILPARMPFEVFTWALDDKLDAIGGFSTTAFLSMPTDKIKFIFAEELKNMNVLFQKILADRDDILWIK